MKKSLGELKPLKITDLLRPHYAVLAGGLIAVAGETVANLLEPWPLKVVLDNVLKSKPGQGWLNQLILSWAGTDKLHVIQFAAIAVLAIAVVGAACPTSRSPSPPRWANG